MPLGALIKSTTSTFINIGVSPSTVVTKVPVLSLEPISNPSLTKAVRSTWISSSVSVAE